MRTAWIAHRATLLPMQLSSHGLRRIQPMSSRTTVSVHPETADRLHNRKEWGESFDDVIVALLEETASTDQATPAQ